ncbi:MAG: M20 family metallopeptidase [Bacteroidota bacterium]
MEDIKIQIHALAEAYQHDTINIRRHFHKNPELSRRENETANFIATQLHAYGIPFQTGVARTGIVALIEGKYPESKVVALRADMDALPIHETNECDYKSVNIGVMHACGHDVHMASLLGAARILNQLKDHFSGTVKLIFQPSEESFPGGATVMIQEGVLKNPDVSCILGQHTLPTLEAGKVGMKGGKYMASTDEIYLTVKGRGGHAATPELNIDPILISAHILTALQQIVSRHAMSAIPTVLSFGRIEGAGQTNIIPDVVKIAGTFRTFDEKWRADAHELITRMAQGIARSMGGDCEVVFDRGYPFLVNDYDLTQRCFAQAQAYLGKENVVDLDLRLTAEDFAYFAQEIPGCFYRLGVRNESRGIVSNLHSSTFDVDETCLKVGMGLMAWLTFNELSFKI